MTPILYPTGVEDPNTVTIPAKTKIFVHPGCSTEISLNNNINMTISKIILEITWFCTTYKYNCK